MTPPESRAYRRGLIIPSLFVIAVFAALMVLGTWQLERKAWKEALIETMERRLVAAPIAIPSPDRWADLDADTVEFRRITVRAEFLYDQEALVYANGSALRTDVSGPGYWVFTPARLADGHIVVVNRGFVPQGRQEADSRAASKMTGLVDIVGIMRWPEASHWFTPRGEPAKKLWFVRDQNAMAAAQDWGAVAPFYIEQELPLAPNGLPQAGRLQVNLPNNHLQYALTWYGLAAVLVGVFVAFVRGRRRERQISESKAVDP